MEAVQGGSGGTGAHPLEDGEGGGGGGGRREGGRGGMEEERVLFEWRLFREVVEGLEHIHSKVGRGEGGGRGGEEGWRRKSFV